MRFVTRIWHPNVSSQTGVICLDTLGAAWSPILTIKSALLSLQSLLNSPEPSDPQDAEVANMLITRPDEFNHFARDWAQRYAGAAKPKPGDPRSGASSSMRQEQPVQPAAEEDAREKKAREDARRRAAYDGYNQNMVDKFVVMGFQVEQIVQAFAYVGIEKAGGEEYELEEEYQGDVIARLFGEV
jgi:ubiquitin-conjugating enzyme (huntingtin interacting protein 2)